jgi:IS30 family transposase
VSGASGVDVGGSGRSGRVLRPVRLIGERIGCDHTIVWRERRRNTKAGKGYRAAAVDSAARARRSRPQTRKVDADPVLWARVVKDLSRSRTPRQIAGRLRLEAADPTVEVMNNSLPAHW